MQANSGHRGFTEAGRRQTPGAFPVLFFFVSLRELRMKEKAGVGKNRVFRPAPDRRSGSP